MRTITLTQLRSLKACRSQLETFERLFGEACAPASLEETLELAHRHFADFDSDWTAKNLLPAAAWADYDRVTATAWADYERAKAAALADYERAKAQAFARAWWAASC